VRAAVKRYSRRRTVAPAVDNVSLDIPRGQVCALVGPNGAGKSSTIAMMLGLVKPTRGELRVLGLNPTRHSFHVRQRVGYVPEQHNIYPWMRVRQVLAFAGRIYPTWDSAEAERLRGRFALPPAMRVKELSRGMLAKLALIVALAHAPELLILDEPTSGLDPLVRREFLDVLLELAHGNGHPRDADGPRRRRTVLFSTHILSDVERAAERVIVMNHGRVVADESTDSLRRRFTKASLVFRQPPPPDLPIAGALRVDRAMREWVAMFRDTPEEQIRRTAAQLGADCLTQPAGFDDVFLMLIEGNDAGQGGNGGQH
jgi:ABC-2 type transport system ATP-binding protein